MSIFRPLFGLLYHGRRNATRLGMRMNQFFLIYSFTKRSASFIIIIARIHLLFSPSSLVIHVTLCAHEARSIFGSEFSKNLIPDYKRALIAISFSFFVFFPVRFWKAFFSFVSISVPFLATILFMVILVLIKILHYSKWERKRGRETERGRPRRELRCEGGENEPEDWRKRMYSDRRHCCIVTRCMFVLVKPHALIQSRKYNRWHDANVTMAMTTIIFVKCRNKKERIQRRKKPGAQAQSLFFGYYANITGCRRTASIGDAVEESCTLLPW